MFKGLKIATMILHLTLLMLFGKFKVDADRIFYEGLQNIWDSSQVYIYKKGVFHDGTPDTFKVPDCFGFLLNPSRLWYENLILDLK